MPDAIDLESRHERRRAHEALAGLRTQRFDLVVTDDVPQSRLPTPDEHVRIDSGVIEGDTVTIGFSAPAADHGWMGAITSAAQAEQMIDPTTGSPHTAHTTNPVPFHLIDEGSKGIKLREGGALEDIAPTMLALLGREKPEEMTGRDLRELE